MVDLEPSVLDEIRQKNQSLFHPSNLLSGSEGAGGNFAVGYLSEEGDLVNKTLERLEGEIDRCDNVGGIIVLHSLGGGTGSGLGCRIIEAIKTKHKEIPILSAAILPSPQVSSVVTEPYNTVFALDTLKRAADACLIFDNEALYALAENKWEVDEPSVDDLNLLITEVLAGLTAPMRFSGFLTVEISIRELITNLVPKPSMHFLMCSFAPLTAPGKSKFEEVSVEQIIDSLFQADSVFAACEPMEGKFMSTAVLYRGEMEDKPQADAALAAVREKIPLSSWIPTAFKIGYVEKPGTSHRKSCVLVANNTEISRVLERICVNFDKLWERQAFANWYFSEGMTEDQINGMRRSVGEILSIYKTAEDRGPAVTAASPATVTPTGTASLPASTATNSSTAEETLEEHSSEVAPPTATEQPPADPVASAPDPTSNGVQASDSSAAGAGDSEGTAYRLRDLVARKQAQDDSSDSQSLEP